MYLNPVEAQIISCIFVTEYCLNYNKPKMANAADYYAMINFYLWLSQSPDYRTVAILSSHILDAEDIFSLFV